MDNGDALRQQLLRLSSSSPPPEESLDEVFQTLWKTRSTGLSPQQKSTVLYLLKLHSLQELDPVLACLRSIIRKGIKESLGEDTIHDLLPLEISSELRNILISILKKYQNQWQEEQLQSSQFPSKRAKISNQAKMLLPSTLAPSPTTDSFLMTCSMEHSKSHRKSNYIGVYEPVPASLNLPLTTSTSLQHDDTTVLPCLKSMTWRFEDRTLVPAKRTAIVSLVLQDSVKSCASEREIKFYISKDTVEAMLRSMTYINEVLSHTA